jgi:hypothetical protein
VTVVVNFDDYRHERRRTETKPRETPREPKPLSVAEALQACLDHPEVLNSWEAGFLTSIRRLPRLSDKQLACLQRIFDKVCGAAEWWAP